MVSFEIGFKSYTSLRAHCSHQISHLTAIPDNMSAGFLRHSCTHLYCCFYKLSGLVNDFKPITTFWPAAYLFCCMCNVLTPNSISKRSRSSHVTVGRLLVYKSKSPSARLAHLKASSPSPCNYGIPLHCSSLRYWTRSVCAQKSYPVEDGLSPPGCSLSMKVLQFKLHGYFHALGVKLCEHCRQCCCLVRSRFLVCRLSYLMDKWVPWSCKRLLLAMALLLSLPCTQSLSRSAIHTYFEVYHGP